MISDRGDDQRRYIEAEHEAEREVEHDQIADAIDKACHRLLSVRGAGGFPSHVGEVGRSRAPPLDNSGQKLDIRAPGEESVTYRAARDFLVRLGAVPVHLL